MYGVRIAWAIEVKIKVPNNKHFTSKEIAVFQKITKLGEEGRFRFSQAVSVPTHRCGHTLDLVIHREEDSLLRSVSVYHSLSSDHLPEMCSLDISKPVSRPVLQTTRNLRAITIIGGSCHKYNFCRDKTRLLSFVATNTATKVILSSNLPLSRQRYACHNKTFVATNTCLL